MFIQLCRYWNWNSSYLLLLLIYIWFLSEHPWLSNNRVEKKLMNRPSFSLWNLDLPCSESLFSLFNFPQCFIMFQHRKLYICFYISTITQSCINTYIMELLFVCFLLCLLLYLNFQNQFLLRNININWVEPNLFLNGNSYYFAKIKHVFTKPKRIK